MSGRTPTHRAGERLGADIVQLFLTDPQKWDKPERHPQTDRILASPIDVVVHSSYVINVASLNNRLRMPSRKAVADQAAAAAEIGAVGLVVHGGHVRDGEDPAAGIANWRKLFERQQDKGGFPVPILVENTAGGDFAMARHLDAIARLWDAIGEFDAGSASTRVTRGRAARNCSASSNGSRRSPAGSTSCI